MRLIQGKISLRTRLFLAMIVLVFIACMMILVATYYQYGSESESYNQFRMERKEKQLRSQINYLVFQNSLSLSSSETWSIYNNDLQAVMNILSVDYSIFDLKGNPLFISFLPLKIIANNYVLDTKIINKIQTNSNKRYVEKNIDEIGKFQSSYSYLIDQSGNPYAILFFPYFEDVSFSENELNTFLQSLYQIYLIMLVIAIGIAYFISKYVTRSLETLRLQINSTGLLKRNKRIHLKNPSREIDSLINSYNNMIDDLEKSAERLAKTEREQAWQEMARQVAHEIKNPLTPMRLSIQNFQRRFDPMDNKNKNKVEEFSRLLIEQIDIMSNVANAFSDFATLPKAQLLPTDIVETTRRATEIFEYENVKFNSTSEKILCPLDEPQWIRAMSNLIQNGLQSVGTKKKAKIEINLFQKNNKIIIEVSDNGAGIDPNLKDKIFEPKFTTKTKGMGLGLGIVKNIIEAHKGQISYSSNSKSGTIFIIKLTLKQS
ncbi:MAG: two-component sensor histidine kinase [Flavobacteriaceae bacterium]|nr:two-component sensor histidine kinase [Flavobacteriaceae bacterium]|tara:strand:- start:29644 stop:31107 length:1464 start_codon:yes stop_codon:yes gene_type:complete